MPRITIQPGDTLSQLSQTHGFSQEEIMRFNPQITNPDLIIAGQELLLPPTQDISPTEAPSAPAPQVDLPEPRAIDEAEDFALPLREQVSTLRQQLDKEIERRREDISEERQMLQQRVDERGEEGERIIREDVEPLTRPFREDLERRERERLFVEENFRENQSLVNELETLLTESTNLAQRMRQQRVPGIAGIQQSSRMQDSLNNVNARIGVVEAVINARNNQIGSAFQMIDRTVQAITADRRDRLSFYETLLNLSESRRDEDRQRIINLDDEDREFINLQIYNIQEELDTAQRRADHIKDMMVDPATATTMAQAGVSLQDTEEEIADKLSQWQISEEIREMNNEMQLEGFKPVPNPGNNTITVTDSQGNEHHYMSPVSGAAGLARAVQAGALNLSQVPADLRAEVAGLVDPSTIRREGDVGELIYADSITGEPLTPRQAARTLVKDSLNEDPSITDAELRSIIRDQIPELTNNTHINDEIRSAREEMKRDITIEEKIKEGARKLKENLGVTPEQALESLISTYAVGLGATKAQAREFTIDDLSPRIQEAIQNAMNEVYGLSEVGGAEVGGDGLFTRIRGIFRTEPEQEITDVTLD